MKRLALLAAVACAASCDRVAPDRTTEVSLTWTYELTLNYNLDVLFVVDDTAAIEPYRATLSGELADAARFFENRAPGGPPAIHVAFVPASLPAATAPGCAPTPARASACGVEAPREYLASLDCGSVDDFSGTFEETFSCLADLGAEGCGSLQPLEAARRALDPATAPAGLSGFLRPDASLQVVVIASGDDASIRNGAPVPVSDYIGFLKGLKADPSKVSLVVVGPEVGAPRLAALFDTFRRNASFGSLDNAGSLGELLTSQNPLRYFVDAGCALGVRDMDLATPGLQADCVVEDLSGDPSLPGVIPSCDAGPPPCWRWVDCPGAPGRGFELDHGEAWCPQRGFEARLTCLGCADPLDPACR